MIYGFLSSRSSLPSFQRTNRNSFRLLVLRGPVLAPRPHVLPLPGSVGRAYTPTGTMGTSVGLHRRTPRPRTEPLLRESDTRWGSSWDRPNVQRWEQACNQTPGRTGLCTGSQRQRTGQDRIPRPGRRVRSPMHRRIGGDSAQAVWLAESRLAATSMKPQLRRASAVRSFNARLSIRHVYVSRDSCLPNGSTLSRAERAKRAKER
jgi:hypothetical protein